MNQKELLAFAKKAAKSMKTEKDLFLYAQGMTTREICIAFKELYDADVSASPISKVTNAVPAQVI